MGLHHSPDKKSQANGQMSTTSSTSVSSHPTEINSHITSAQQQPIIPSNGQGHTNICTTTRNDSQPKGVIPRNQADANRDGKCKLCTKKNSRWMVCCDVCEEWYHFSCVGVDSSVREKDFICEKCQIPKTNTTEVQNKPKSRSSKHVAKLKLARLEEEHKSKLKLAEEERRMQEKRDHDYALKLQKAEEELLKQKFEYLENLSSKASSSDDRESITNNWVASGGHTLGKQTHQSNPHSPIDQKSNKENCLHQTKMDEPGNYILTTADLLLFEKNNIDAKVQKEKVEVSRQIIHNSAVPLINTTSMPKIQSNENQARMPPNVFKPFTPWEYTTPEYSTEPKNLLVPAVHTEGMLTASQVQARMVLGKKDLPEFGGNPSDWTIFYNAYVRTTEKCGYSNDENLERLLKTLKGDARKLVKARLITSDTVPSVIETLRRRFGNPTFIINELIQNARKIPSLKNDNIDSLLDLAAAVEDLVATIVYSHLQDELRNRTLLNELVMKLPFHFQMNWASYARNEPCPDLQMFNNWLIGIADTACQIPKLQQVDGRFEKKTFGRSNKRTTYHIAAHDVQGNKKTDGWSNSKQPNTSNCPACEIKDHKITDCQVFIDMDKRQRWNVIVEKKLCRTCFGNHHTNNCKKKRNCGVDGCTKIHHQMLHNSRNNTEGTTSKIDAKQEVVESHNHQLNNHGVSSSILYRILPVKLYGKNKSLDTFAFMDDGSSTTLIEKKMADELELSGPGSDLCIKWTSNVTRIERNSKKVDLQIAGIKDTNKRYALSEIQTVESLNLPSQSVGDDILYHSHLRKLPIAKYNHAKPTILIGMDQYKLCVPLKIREKESAPTATKTRLGWSLAGPLKRGSEIRLNIHECDCKNDDQIHNLVKEFFTIESLGSVPGIKAIESQENIRARYVLESTTKLCEGGKYETGLIWKTDEIQLPESRMMAYRRFLCLEKKLDRDEELRENVELQISEYLKKGYARKLTEAEAKQTSPCTWYLPVFTVRNPNKPAKIRLVWDAAAKSNGIALNDVLLKGPDMLNPLLEVLMRFRERPIAVGGDLKEMFHQVRVKREDQDAQRFFWRSEANQKPQEYVMQVMTFGAACSPTSAHYVLRKNSDRFINESPRAVQAIQNNHYVDDWLDSFGTVEEAIRISDDVKRIHNAGGFSIHNWVSNSTDVLTHMQDAGTIQKSLTRFDSSVERVLGMHWKTVTDSFVFIINRKRLDPEIIEGQRTPTKREVLSTVMSTFDPLGLIASFVVFAKVLLQDIWRSGVEWDEKILDEQDQKWKFWTEQFQYIENLSIPRCYMEEWSNDLTYELHVFVDASEVAYATTAYICSLNNNIRQCTLIASKTRVAPTKPTSIPRLELLGAVLGARLLKTIEKSHTIQFKQRFLWTDSRTVLCWLRSDARKYRQFVALRIAEVLDITDVLEWRWVPSQENVADEATKWGPSPQFTINSRWYNGPNFLLQPPENWPVEIATVTDPVEDEIRPIHIHNLNTIQETVAPNADNFSTWERLLHITSTVPKVFDHWYKKSKKETTRRYTHTTSPDELTQAAKVLFKKAQESVYQEEISQLRFGRNVEKTSKIYQYSPYIDEDGLIRMRGRIENAPGILHDTKRPVILPYDNRITFLYADYFHRKYLHKNHDTALNEIRQRVAIPKLRTLMKTVRKACQKCRNVYAKPCAPEMGALPSARLQIYCRPFSYVGVDYFGPIEVSVGRRIEKRYGSLFTCLTTRGIHIEVAHALTTDSCILALTRFMSRRGMPIEIMSDNATNFRGASKELMDLVNSLSRDTIAQNFPEVKWSFIPPSSPHFGGPWEIMVRTVKSNLYEILRQKHPSDEVLLTYLAQVENIVNSRPLTDVPVDNESSEAITPNHLIHGTSSGVKPYFDKGLEEGLYKRQWITVEQMSTSFWRRFVNEYLPTLTKRTKWFEKAKPLVIGDIVIVVDERNPRNTWPKGIVIDVNKGTDGQTRSAIVKTQYGTYTKPTVKLAVLDVRSKQPQGQPSQLTGGDNVGNTAN